MASYLQEIKELRRQMAAIPQLSKKQKITTEEIAHPPQTPGREHPPPPSCCLFHRIGSLPEVYFTLFDVLSAMKSTADCQDQVSPMHIGQAGCLFLPPSLLCHVFSSYLFWQLGANGKEALEQQRKS